MAELIVTRSGDSTRRFALDRDELVIGSDPSCDLVLDSRFVSRRHAALQHKGNTYEVRDAGSRNGTFVNGKELDKPQGGREFGKPQRLKDKDEIVIADFFLTLWEAPQRQRTEPFEVRLPEKFTVDVGAREVWIGSSKVNVRFSVNEFKLLAFLYENRGRVCSHAQIGDHVWGSDLVGGSRLPKYTDNMIQRLVFLLRSKIKKAKHLTGEYVVNVPGAGYRLDERPES